MNFFYRFINNLRALRAWENAASFYSNFTVPSRPSDGDLKNYRLVINSTLDNFRRVLVLGTTPQIRNMLADFEGEIIIADFSKEMYRVAEPRVVPAILAKENFIRANWLYLGDIIVPDSVDLVVGDLVFNNIYFEAREKFLNAIQQVLKPGGVFLTRVKLHNPYWRSIDPMDIVRFDLQSMVSGSLASPFMLYRLGDKILDEKTYSFRSRDFEPFLQDVLLKPIDAAQKNYIRYQIRNYKNIDMIRSFYPKAIFESLAAEYFRIENALIAHDYKESEFFPIYVLKKR